MTKPPLLPDEIGRLAALKQYGLLDTPPDMVLDNLTQAAADLCEAPVALISLVDSDRQWFKSCCGLTINETPRDLSFCTHAIEQPNTLMEIEDARRDPRFHDNLLVIGEPHIRFYAGQPLVNSNGFALGTLCVIDYKPRKLTQAQRSGLPHLAQAVVGLFDERLDSKISAIDHVIENALEHGVVMADPYKPDCPISYVNKAFTTLTGYQRAEVIGKNCRFLQGPETDPHTLSVLHNAIENFEACTVTLKNYRKNGGSFWNELTVSPVKNAEGKVTSLVAILQDVSYRILAQERTRQLSTATQEREQARAMRDQLAQIVEDSVNEIYIAEAKSYQLINANRAARENLGYSLTEAKQLMPWDFVLGLSPESVEELVSPLRDGTLAAHTFETHHRRKDGSTYPVATHLQYMASQDPPVYTAIVQDISERQQQEEQVRLRDRAIEALNIGVSIANMGDSRRPLIHVNQSLCGTMGYTADEILGQSLDFLIPVRFHDILQTHCQQYVENPKERSISVHLEITGLRKNQSEFPMELSLNSVGTAERPLMSIAIRDISYRMKLESETHKLRQELAHMGRLTTLGEMATGLAHELNQPLTAIIQSTDAALVTVEQNARVNPLLSDLLSDIESEAQRAGDIIRAMRQFTLKDNSSRTTFDLKDLVLQTLALIATEIRSNKIEVRTYLDGNYPVVAHRVQIAQVLVNLLRNSIEAIVQSNSHERVIAVSVTRSDDKFILKVMDSGPGLKYDLSTRTTFQSSKPDGMGMGLSISRSLLETHDGELWSDSSRTEKDSLTGAHISFSLPIMPEQELVE